MHTPTAFIIPFKFVLSKHSIQPVSPVIVPFIAVSSASAAVAIIMLTILAIKYMASSPNDRAEIKRGAGVYVVGAIVMMSASFLVTVIKEFSDNSIKVS